MRVRYTPRARADLEGIYEYLKERAPATAQSFKSTIERQIGWLCDFPYMAPTTDEPGIRELTLTRYPYKIYYEVSDAFFISRGDRSPRPQMDTLRFAGARGTNRWPKPSEERCGCSSPRPLMCAPSG
jgi:plasmid stabilization system protein ParE